MKLKNILLGCVIIFGSLTLSGCYTQLTMFQPKSENDDSEEFYQYSVAGPVRSIGMYAQDGSGTSLGLAYQMMYNRFRGFMGYGNRYNYYNPYYYGGYYNDYTFNRYTLAGHTMYVPLAEFPEKGTLRTFTKDRLKTYKTNLNTTRSSNESDYTNTNGADTNSSNVSSTRSSTGSSSSSTSSSGGRRVTKRN